MHDRSYTSSKDSIVANKNISQQTLVHDGCNTNSSRLTQYVAAIIGMFNNILLMIQKFTLYNIQLIYINVFRYALRMSS